jgi:hypothetical protein
MTLKILENRLLAIRAAARSPVMLPVLSRQIPVEVRESQALLHLGLQTTPIQDMLAIPLLMSAADTYGQWINQALTLSKLRCT